MGAPWHAKPCHCQEHAQAASIQSEIINENLCIVPFETIMWGICLDTEHGSLGEPDCAWLRPPTPHL